jgi:hypothetical protein
MQQQQVERARAAPEPQERARPPQEPPRRSAQQEMLQRAEQIRQRQDGDRPQRGGRGD